LADDRVANGRKYNQMEKGFNRPNQNKAIKGNRQGNENSFLYFADDNVHGITNL